MSRWISDLSRQGALGFRDGTSQGARRMAALDPAYAPIDERTSADLLRFVQAYTQKLRFFEVEPATGTLTGNRSWRALAERVSDTSPDEASSDVSVEDMVAFLANPERFAGDRAQWMGRPHFALLLTFLQLLGHARDHLNGFTRRHLDYYYRDILEMTPQPPVADRAAVVFRLRPNANNVRLPAGTELRAGQDAEGNDRFYKTEREIVVNHAQVVDLRSVFVDRQVTGIPDVRSDRSLTASQALMQMLQLALGAPLPGDAVPPFREAAIDVAHLRTIHVLLKATDDTLFLEHHERRALMRLVRRRRGARADAEWGEIYRMMGVESPPPPVHDQVSLNAAIRTRLLELGLHEDADEDELYDQRTDPNTRTRIDAELPELGDGGVSPFDRFVEIMRRKVLANADWEDIDDLLERAGRRQRDVVEWSRPPGGPSDVDGRLASAYEGRLPLKFPEAENIEAYEDLVQAYEAHFAMSAERLQILAAFAEQIDGDPSSEAHDWRDIDRFLADAHAEGMYAARRAEIKEVRDGREDLTAFDEVAGFVSGSSAPYAWPDSRARLALHVGAPLLQGLDRFRQGLIDDELPVGQGWEDVDRAFEVAWRSVQALQVPVAERVTVKNIYAFEDATQAKVRSSTHGWRPFGQRPIDRGPETAQGASIGWAVTSPLLCLSEGRRKLTVTFGFGRSGFDAVALSNATDGALRIEVSTEEGWMTPTVGEVKIVSSAEGYAELIGVSSDGGDQPGFQIELEVGPDGDPIVAPADRRHPWPVLRFQLSPQWMEDAGEWQMPVDAFSKLELTAVHVRAEVAGLQGLQLQRDDRTLDAQAPFDLLGRRWTGARLYMDHPELSRTRLDQLSLDIHWTEATGHSFSAHLGMVDRNLEQSMLNRTHLAIPQDTPTALVVPDVPAALADDYEGRSDLMRQSDVRTASRYLFLDLTRTASATEDPDASTLGEPPKVKRVTASYAASIELQPAATDRVHQVLHVHPFGMSALDGPHLMPRYDDAGELYVGIRDLSPPQNLSLLLQLADGTSDPEAEQAPVTWSYLDGDHFKPLGEEVLSDTTRSLINTGTAELALPPAAHGDRLPGDLYWLRICASKSTRSACDAIAIRTQAVSARFDDRDNAASHYDQPLPPSTIDRLDLPQAGIAEVEQPYSSFGGRPAERAAALDTRVSERLRHKHRALTVWDYERLVLHRFAQIYKAKGQPSEGGVDVIVVPDVRRVTPRDTLSPRAPANLLAEIEDYLTERAPPTARVRVRNPHYVAVQVRLGVRLRDGVDVRAAERLLNDDLVRFLSPWAFDDGAEVVIGGRIYANSIIDFVERRDYVDFVANIKLFRSDDGVDFDLVPVASADYHVASERPDEVLVAAPRHFFDLLQDTAVESATFTGINSMRIELDFTVG